MKKVVILSTLAAAGLASAAHGQAFTLQLFLTARAVSGSSPSETVADIQEGGSIAATAGTRYRVDVRYRINDNVADTVGSRGLSAAALILTRSGTGTGTTSRAFLTFDQQGDSAVTNPDTSGITTAADGPTTGLIGQFRGGLTADDAAPNGGANGLSTAAAPLLPLALSNPGHRSWGTTGNPTAANTNASTTRWALYTFEFVYQGGQVNFNVTAQADATTGNRFGYFQQTGGTVSPVPVTSQSAQDGNISFVPAPSAAALLGLGGLIAARRRRA